MFGSARLTKTVVDTIETLVDVVRFKQLFIVEYLLQRPSRPYT